MPRYNKINAGPATETSMQVKEAIASVALTPGILAILGNDGQFAPASASSTEEVYVVQENYLLLQGVDEDWAAGDRAIGIHLFSSRIVRARVADTVNVGEGDPLSLGANGLLVAATSGSRVVAFASEGYNNNTGATQLVSVRPAGGALAPSV